MGGGQIPAAAARRSGSARETGRTDRMRTAMRMLLAAGLCAAASMDGAEPPSHCLAVEVTVFSCRAGRKTASVCAEKSYPAKGSSLKYRFGLPGKIEIELPKGSAGSSLTEARGETFPNGGQTGYLRFWNKSTAYVLFHSNLRDGSAWSEKAGIAVETAGKRSALMLCTSPLESKLLDTRFMETVLGNLDNPEAEGFDFP